MLVLKLIGYWMPLAQPSPLDLTRPTRIEVPDRGWPDVRELVDPGWRPNDRARVLRYLRAGHDVRGFLGSSAWRFDCGINRREWKRIVGASRREMGLAGGPRALRRATCRAA